MNLNLKAKKKNTYDAIVVGTGISGGWAAKELTENGLNTLVLDRGRNVRHPSDYPTATMEPWDLPRNNRITPEDEEKYHIQNRTGWVNEATKHWWAVDTDQPYIEKNRFDWIRGYHVGGRSLMWGRQSYRLSQMDFEANAREGIAIDWPIRYEDIEPWYDYVEEFAGISGQPEGLAHLPDSKFLPAMELNCVEQHSREKIAEHFNGRLMTIGRVANLTQPHSGRGACQFRNKCNRGCPYGAYFSSNSSTLPAAERTGNMTLRPNSIVNKVIYDEELGRATGIEVIDAETLDVVEYYARIIFLNASAINSTLIMLNSRSNRFPDGLGNDSGELGHNIMDHHYRVGASGAIEGFEDRYYWGRRPNGFYIARFANIGNDRRDYLRGFGYQGSASREGWWRGVRELSIGAELKEFVQTPGQWTMGMTGFGEVLPDHRNHMYLDFDQTDKFGQPLIVFDCEFRENELNMREDMKNDAAEMLEAAGFKDVTTYDQETGMGLGIHEMGTARMGRDPQTSVLNEWNQVHACKNVFVTDGACMTSSACQNPSLTYMALTARAANYAVEELNRQNI